MNNFITRFYSPLLGRFTQPDSIIPSLSNSQAWNRYAYAYNNPLNYTDPSGHVPCLDGICNNNSEWLGVNNTSYASSIQLNTHGSQYDPFNPETGEFMDNASWNLCGQVILSLILETEMPEYSYQLYKIWQEGTEGRKGPTYGIDLLRAMKKVFPQIEKWNAIHSSYSQYNKLANGNIAENQLYESTWYYGDNYQLVAMDKTISALQKGHYPIFLADFDSNTGYLVENRRERNHWVLVVAVSEKEVNVFNPFSNRFERYSTGFFINSIRDDLDGSITMIEVWKENE